MSVRWQPIAYGYLGLVAFWAAVQSGPAKKLGGLADDLTKLVGRLFDPEIAGIPNKHDGQATDINQTAPPGSPDIPADAPPAPNCPPGFTPLYDKVSHQWRCIGDLPIPGGAPKRGGGIEDFSAGNPPGRGLATFTAPNGQRVTVAANYVARFQGFLSDLWNAGYHFQDVEGYSYRNIAGTDQLSKHATGEAIDIDPQPNRGTRLGGGGARYGEFDPRRILPLLSKWHLDWGGLWQGQEDPMHFSSGG